MAETSILIPGRTSRQGCGISEKAELKIVEDATCTFCGCMCDDIALKVDGDRITEAKSACVLGKSWFFNQHLTDDPACLIEGRPAPLEEGIERAARILTEAKYPIIYGLSDTTSEAQCVAVSIGDWIGGCVDTTTSVCQGPSGIAFQDVGEVTCTLGEIKNRGDLIIFWGSNPAESHPRHFAKYSLMPKSTYLPRGRKDRYCVLVDVRKTKSAKAADLFIQIKPRKDYQALWTLRALAKGVELDPVLVEAETGVPLSTKDTPTTRVATVVFHTATYGINTAGTVYRMDDVPIPLRPAFESNLPTDEAVLKQIETRVRELVAISNPNN